MKPKMIRNKNTPSARQNKRPIVRRYLLQRKTPTQEVLDIITAKGIVSQKELLNILSPRGLAAHERLSTITIKRAIDTLLNQQKLIVELPYEQRRENGINETDQRIKYYLLTQQKKDQRRIGLLFDSLKSNDGDERTAALEELQDIDDIRLTSKEIDKLVTAITEFDLALLPYTEQAPKIVHNYVEKGILPTQEHIDNLETCLRGQFKKHTLLELHQDTICLELLTTVSLLGRPFIMDVFHELLKHKKLAEYSGMFTAWEHAKILQDHDEELYKLRMKHLNTHTGTAIQEIRRTADKALKEHQQKFKELEKILTMVQQ